MESIKALKEASENYHKVKEEFTEKCKSLLEKSFNELFEKYPALEEVRWNQYSPYFNDGDSCEFSANTEYCEINGESPDDKECDREIIVDYGKWNGTEYVGRKTAINPNYNPEKGDMVNDVKDLLALIPDDVYEEMYDNHTSVIVTREGIETEDYEHD
jgi:hypothetical protein